MTILETNKIDLIGTRPDTQVVRLVIVDHLDWSDFDEHSRLIQDKVNAYLEFVKSGQIRRSSLEHLPLDPKIKIELCVQHAPTVLAQAFLEKVRSFLIDVGIVFEVSIKDPPCEA